MSDTARFTTAKAAEAFLLGGNATVTLVSTKTGTRFTYKIRAADDGKAFFVSLLSGPDNEGDYKYLGRIAGDRFWQGRKNPKPGDIDHARPWPTGATTPTNLGGLCRRHHRLKQRRHWTYHLAPDGTATWTSPSGTTRTTQPDHAALPPPPLPEPTTAPQPELVTVEPPPF